MQKFFFFIVDKALLEIADDELDRQTLTPKEIILLGEHWEKLDVCTLCFNPYVTISNNC